MKPVLLVFLVQFLACPSHSQSLIFDGSLSGIADGGYVYLQESRSFLKEKTVQDSARVTHGSFRFKLKIAPGQADVYYFSTLPIRYTADGPDRGGDRFGRIIWVYLQPGHMNINGDAALLDMATIDGDAWAKEEGEYYTKRRKNTQWSQFVKEYNAAEAKGELAGLSRAKVDSMFLFKAMSGIVIYRNIARSWVGQHLQSPFSAAVLLEDLRPWFEGSDERDEFYVKLSPEAKANVPAHVLAAILHK